MLGGIGKAGWATMLVSGGLMLGASVSARQPIWRRLLRQSGRADCGAGATTARKGNRKVKLEVSGHVNEAFLWWDDGVESNACVYTNDNARSRFRFKGDAKITDDVKAGFLIEVGVRGANSKRFDQEDPDGCTAPFFCDLRQIPRPNRCGFDLRHSVWYIDSKKFGRIWVGKTGGAGDSVTEVNLAATKDVLKYSGHRRHGPRPLRACRRYFNLLTVAPPAVGRVLNGGSSFAAAATTW